MNKENPVNPDTDHQNIEWEAWLEIRKKSIQDEFHSAKQYNHAIIFAGFAGFFGLWAIVKNTIDSTALSFSVLLMLISGVVFIGWEVYRMIYLTLRISHASNAAENTTDARAEFATADKAERDGIVRLMRYWPWVLGASIIPALISVAIFAYTMASDLLAKLIFCPQ